MCRITLIEGELIIERKTLLSSIYDQNILCTPIKSNIHSKSSIYSSYSLIASYKVNNYTVR